MTTNNPPPIPSNAGPNSLSLALNEPLQGLERPQVTVFHPDPALLRPSTDRFADNRRKSVPDIFHRIERVGSPGKNHLYRFLYHKYCQNCKSSTLSGYCTSLTFFLTFVETQCKKQIERINRNDLEAFIEHEQDRGLGPSTLHLRLMNIYSFIRYLVDQGHLPSDMLVRKIKIKVPDALPRAMDPLDVKRLLRVIHKVRDRAMILVLLRTGMRIGELLNLKIADVQMMERKILIWEGEKNWTGRAVYISHDVHNAMCHWLNVRDPLKAHVFYSRCRSTMGYTNAREMLSKYMAKAGLSGKGYSLHSLRHTFATDLLNAGMRLECLQQLLGHKSLEMTLRYARLTDKTREEEYFKAMAVIEGEKTDESDRLDAAVPTSFKASELLSPYDPELYQ